MDRLFIILLAWITLFAGTMSADLIDADSVPEDLRLDEENLKISNALGYFARSVFLAYGGASPETFQSYLSKALREVPESKELLNHAAIPYLRRGDFKGLVKMLSPIAEDNPEALSLHVFLGLMCRRAEMLDEGVNVFEHIAYNLNDYEPLVIRELSAFYWATDQQKKIPVLLKKANWEKEFKDHFVVDFVWALYHKGMASQERENGRKKAADRHQKRAIKHARRAAELFGPEESLKSCETLAEVFIDNGEYLAAASLFQKTANQFPDQTIAILTRRAECLARGGEEEAAREQLHAFNLREIKNARLLILIGQAALRAGDSHFTQKAYEQAMKQAPNSAPIRFAYAAILQFAGKPEAALDILNKLPELTAEGFLRKARILSNLKRWEEADTAWKKAGELAQAAKQDMFKTVSYLLLGATIKDGLGHLEEASTLARKAVEKEPENPLAANYLGYTLADMGQNLDKAEKLILFALSKDPENDAYLDSLAWVYFRQERWKEAGQAMARCLKITGDFNDAVILEHAGDIFAANGAHGMARLYWLQALREKPENVTALQEKLNTIKFPINP